MWLGRRVPSWSYLDAHRLPKPLFGGRCHRCSDDHPLVIDRQAQSRLAQSRSPFSRETKELNSAQS